MDNFADDQIESTLYRDIQNDLTITSHTTIPTGFLEHLSEVKWGTSGPLYRVNFNTNSILNEKGSIFIAMKKSDKLIGTYTIHPRIFDGTPNLRRAYLNANFTVEPSLTDTGYGKILMGEAQKYLVQNAPNEALLYGWVDAQNDRSMRCATKFEGCNLGEMHVFPFSRFKPQTKVEVTTLQQNDISELSFKINQLYNGYEMLNKSALEPMNTYVVKSYGEIIASVKALKHSWSIFKIPGLLGGMFFKLCSSFKPANNFLNPADFKFLWMGDHYFAPGHEKTLHQLMEALLVNHNTKHAMMAWDKKGKVFTQFAKELNFGMMQKASADLPLNLMGMIKNSQQKLGGPLYMPPQDANA